MTDDEIRKLAEKQGWVAVDSWWSMAIPRFRAMLEEHAAQHRAQSDGATCPACEATSIIVGTQCRVCGVFSPHLTPEPTCETCKQYHSFAHVEPRSTQIG